MKAVAALLVTLVACTTPPPQVTALDAQRANVAIEQLDKGRSLLISRCSGCHATPLPAQQTAAAWPQKIDEMSERSRLTVDEHKLIELYLVIKSAP